MQKKARLRTSGHFLPGGKAILFTIGTAALFDEARIAVLDLRTGEQRVLLEGGTSPRYAPTGHLIYARAGSLFAVRFDPDRLQVKGSPVPVVEGVSIMSGLGFGDYSFSDSGTLVYTPGELQEENRTMVWVDRMGTSERLRAPPRPYANPNISPDGKQVAVSIMGGEHNVSDIWVYDLARGALSRLTSGYFNFAPVWTPDGKRVTFRSTTPSLKNGISWVPADLSGPIEQPVTAVPAATPGSWSPDGAELVFAQGIPLKTGIWLLPRPGGGAAQQKASRLQGFRHDTDIRTAVPGTGRQMADLDRWRHLSALGEERARAFLSQRRQNDGGGDRGEAGLDRGHTQDVV